MQLERITWIDSHGLELGAWGEVSVWREDFDDPEVYHIITVGIVAAESDDLVLVVHSARMANADQAMGGLAIPKGCIVSREKLRV